MSPKTFLRSLRLPTTADHNPDAGLPPPALAMTPKVRGRTKPLKTHRMRRRSTDRDRDRDRDRDVEAGLGGLSEKGKNKSTDVDADEEDEQERNREQEDEGETKNRIPLRVRWARFKKRIGTGSNLSDSILDPLESVSASATEASLRQQLDRVNGGGTGTGANTEIGAESNAKEGALSAKELRQARDGKEGRVRVDEEPVDQIVVDNVFLTGERAGSVTHTHTHTVSQGPPSEVPNQTSGGTTTHGE